MTWFEVIRKEPPIFQTLFDLGKRLVMGRIRMLKETPHRLTGYVIPYTKEIIVPRAIQLMKENPDLTQKEALNQSFDRKEYLKYGIKRNVDSIIDRREEE
jgi:hypothetical protein